MFPIGLGNPEKREGILQSGKSLGILNRLEKLRKITQNTGKGREFQTNVIYNFLVMFKLTVYYKLKWIKFSVGKNTQNFKKNNGKWKKKTGKAGNFVTPEKLEPWTSTTSS